MKYTQFLLDTFYNPNGCGTITGAHVVSRTEEKQSGDVVKFFFVLDGERIKEVKFQACGSVVLFASLSAITNLISGLTLTEAQEINEKQIIKEIKQVNRCDYPTITFAIYALNRAIQTAIKKTSKGFTEQKKQVKVRNLTISNGIKVYGEEENPEEIIEEASIEIKQIDDEDEASLPAPVVISHDELEEREEIELIEPQTIIAKKDIIESIPTKIEVRVVEDDEVVIEEPTKPAEEEATEEVVLTEEVEAEKKEEVKQTEIFVLNENKNVKLSLIDESNSNDDVIDEIDSITAKLTDAITKLNFKFDVDED